MNKLALMTLSILLLANLSITAYSYSAQQQELASKDELKKQTADLQSQLATLTSNMNNLQNKKTSLEVHMADLEGQLFALNESAANLQTQNVNLQNQNDALQSQIQIGSTRGGFPKIITRLGATDVRDTPAPGHPWSGQTRLYVSGEIWNVGAVAACNCTLHITLYHGKDVANETTVELGLIAVGSWVNVAVNINYSGEALTNWSMTPEYQ